MAAAQNSGDSRFAKIANITNAAKLTNLTKLLRVDPEYAESVAKNNPFSPTFGTSPPALAGRDAILEDLDEAFETGPSHPDYTVLFIGIRGIGKTVMLNAAEDMVRKRGWLVVAEQGNPSGLIERLRDGAARLLAEFDSEPSRRVSGLQAAGMGIAFEHRSSSQGPQDLRSILGSLGDRLAQTGSGLLITVDELHAADVGEVRELGGILQHVTRREGRPIAFAGAALPYIEDELLQGQLATFLQRCSRYDIGPLDAAATRNALEIPMSRSAATIDDHALGRAVEAANGYPFMVQLIGFYTWKAVHDPAAGINDADFTVGINRAESRIGRLVIAPTWNELSNTDRRFLAAMTEDTGDSTLDAIAQGMGVSTNYAHVYRRRLERAGMIVTTARNTVAFGYPTARAWVSQRTVQLPPQ